MDAKTAILARARDAISRSQQDRPVRPIPRDYIRSTEHAPGSDAVVEEMIEKLEDYSAQVVVVSSEDEAADAISSFLVDQKATSVVVPEREIATTTSAMEVVPREPVRALSESRASSRFLPVSAEVAEPSVVVVVAFSDM